MVGLVLLAASGVQDTALLLGILWGTEVFLLGIALFFTRRQAGGPWRALGFHQPVALGGLALTLVAFGASTGFALLYGLAVAHLGLPLLRPPSVFPFLKGLPGVERAAVGLLLVGVAPVAEEAFFRGFLVQGLVPPWSAGSAILASAFLFSVSHGVVGLLLPTFVAGLLFGLLFLKARSLWAPILAHALQNAVVVAFLL